MIKKIVIGVVILLAVLGGAAYFLYSNLGPILKAAIETYGSEATQSQVKVASVSLSGWSGSGTISGVTVDDPKGFTTPHAFELSSISIGVDTSTLTHNPIVVNDVTITSPHVTYEQGPNGSNLQALQQNVTRYAGGSASAPSPTAQAPGPSPNATPPSSSSGAPSSGASPSASPSSTSAERKLIIDKLDVTGGQVTVAASLLKGRTLTTSLPPIHLTDIGKKEGGATPAEVAQLVISAISEQAAKAGADELQKSLGGAAQQKLETLQTTSPGVSSQLKGLLGK